MTTYITAVIIAVLIAITILHDISIYRLGCKVDMLQTFIDVTLRGLEDYVLGQRSNADQRIQDVESVESVEADRKPEPTISKMEQVDKDINVRSKDELQTCSVNGRPYDCGNCEYFRCTADEPQAERNE